LYGFVKRPQKTLARKGPTSHDFVLTAEFNSLKTILKEKSKKSLKE
jgi:hypothetical protein